MTKLFAICFCCTLIVPAKAQQSTFNDTMLLQPVELSAVRASERMPFTKTNLTKKDIEKNNIGQDLPFLLNKVPGVVVKSDAGNGIGYTNMRIRGTDATRINITLNGIPFNDAESQGSFFVDMPDIASSASNIQVQRGVGTSSNGSGAFGASINIGTNEIEKNRKLSFNNTVGSYHSIKNTLNFNSGLLNKHFTVDARLSHIRSDGYIERAASRLYSLFGSMAYINNKNSVRFNFISGKEKVAILAPCHLNPQSPFSAWLNRDIKTFNLPSSIKPSPGQYQSVSSENIFPFGAPGGITNDDSHPSITS